MNPSLVKVIFPNLNKEIFVDQECVIADACLQAGQPLDYVCGGQGTCGKCRVQIEKNGQVLTVLGCMERVSEEVKILIGENEKRQKNGQILTEDDADLSDFNPTLVKKYIAKELIATPMCGGQWEAIKELIGLDLKKPALRHLKDITTLSLRSEVRGFTLIIDEGELVGVESGDTSNSLYGVAIDLGTTTIAAYLYDLVSGKKMGTYSALNGQAAYGADVLTRIAVAMQPEGLEQLQKAVISTIQDLIQKMGTELGVEREMIYSIIICGNTAMQHLFLGLNPKQLSRAPFTSVTLIDVKVCASALGLKINEKGTVHFLPLIGGFVGADTVAAVLSTDMGNSQSIKLMIDLGTNGEIVIGNQQKMLAASAAAGPALEGAGIKFGMRGTDGAIERVQLTESELHLKTIGDSKPIGICGSGLVDLIAEMVKMRMITERGRLCTREIYIESNGDHPIAKRLDLIDGERGFVIADEMESGTGEKIYLSQKDIRQLQLAKGAIAAAYQILIKRFGIEETQIEEILVAGAFGNYVDTEQAQLIGLLPDFENVPVRSVGNAAGAGVQLFLLSQTKQDMLFAKMEKIEHIELASDKEFSTIFSKTMNFETV